MASPSRTVALLLVAVAASACTQRSDFNQVVIDEVTAYHAQDQLRVYPSRRIKLQPPRRTQADPKHSITRRTPGVVVAIDEVDGTQRVWVTFDRHCREPQCAFPFLEDDDGTFTFAGDPRTKLDVLRYRIRRYTIEHERLNATSGT